MNFNTTPVFNDLSEDTRTTLLTRAETRPIAAGEIIFREGDAAETAYMLAAGSCVISREMRPLHEARPGDWLDVLAALGNIPHDQTAIAKTACEVLCWPVDVLWNHPAFARAARAYMAANLQQARQRLDELLTPVHYTGSAAVLPGPFMFEGVRMVIALCDADLATVQRWLPEGLSLLRRPGRGRGSVFLALARFPNAYPEERPYAAFAYDETTCFIPVRLGANFGLYVPFIYPSAWEPILLGREIYGFPKRLGKTEFSATSAQLTVDGEPNFRLSWQGSEDTSEPRLVRALSGWLGVEGVTAETAFRAGEVIRSVMRLPAYRRIEVYNHKQVLAAGATVDEPRYDVNCLTRAAFGVLRWHHIARMTAPELHVSGGPLQEAGLTLREGYITRLDMRLSVAAIAHTYDKLL